MKRELLDHFSQRIPSNYCIAELRDHVTTTELDVLIKIGSLEVQESIGDGEESIVVGRKMRINLSHQLGRQAREPIDALQSKEGQSMRRGEGRVQPDSPGFHLLRQYYP